MTSKNPIQDLFAALGGAAGVAELCGVPKNTADSWRKRLRIPARHWLTIVRSTAGATMGLSLETLAEMHEPADLGRSEGSAGEEPVSEEVAA